MGFLARFFTPRRAPLPLTLYVRESCGLCDEMLRELEASGLAGECTLTIVDLDRGADAALRAEYTDCVPVLTLGGRVLAKGRLQRGGFEKRFRRMAAEHRAAEGRLAEDRAVARGERSL